MAERKKAVTTPQVTKQERKANKETPRAVSVNHAAVAEFACYGPQSRVEQLFREVHNTVKRLGLKTGRSGGFSKVERRGANPPGLLDLVRWMASMDKNHPDVEFLKNLYVTLADRIPPNVLNELKKGAPGTALA